jgi:hypothetical protein
MIMPFSTLALALNILISLMANERQPADVLDASLSLDEMRSNVIFV